MSNRASLRRTMFTGDGDDAGWGWRICDDYFRSYADDCNEQDVPKDPLQLLSKACAEATEQERLVISFERNQAFATQRLALHQIADHAGAVRPARSGCVSCAG